MGNRKPALSNVEGDLRLTIAGCPTLAAFLFLPHRGPHGQVFVRGAEVWIFRWDGDFQCASVPEVR
jgi:hypothetical protein